MIKMGIKANGWVASRANEEKTKKVVSETIADELITEGSDNNQTKLKKVVSWQLKTSKHSDFSIMNLMAIYPSVSSSKE